MKNTKQKVEEEKATDAGQLNDQYESIVTNLTHLMASAASQGELHRVCKYAEILRETHGAFWAEWVLLSGGTD